MSKQVVLHPISISLYPTLYLFGAHYDFFEPDVIFRPALVSCGLFVGLWLAVGTLRKEYKHTAIFVSAAILLFYSFAALQEAAAKGGLDNVQAGNKIVLGIVALVVVAVVLYIKFRKYVDQVTYLLNVIGIFLLITPVMMGVFQYFRGATAANLLPDRKPLFASDAALTLPEQPPDIYYLVLDGYGRGDFLAEEFDFDNSAMLDFLGEQGFYVAERSRANYPMTLVSVASSLNYEYLDKLLGTQFGGFPDRSFARALVRDSRVVKLLRRAGYKIISVESEYYEANIAGADVEMKSWWHLNIFEGTVFGMTPIPWLATKMGTPLLYNMHRNRILYAFDQLLDAAEQPGPKFVYAHIFVGHPPFVFGPNGERVNRADAYSWDEGEEYTEAPGRTREDYIAGYRDQVTYLNGKLRLALTTIIEKAARPPVIVAHGDHGPGSRLRIDRLEGTDIKERYSIFNVYHLPPAPENAGSAVELYPSISPVNSFRVIFNRYFGTDYPLLEDKSIYTPFLEPYRFIPVPDEEREDESEAPTGAAAASGL